MVMTNNLHLVLTYYGHWFVFKEFPKNDLVKMFYVCYKWNLRVFLLITKIKVFIEYGENIE